MQNEQRNTFCEHVVAALSADFKRIARQSRGELESHDVASDAFLMIHDLSHDYDPLPAPNDVDFHQMILGRLYNQSVTWADPHFRWDVRIDEDQVGDDGGAMANGVAARLASPAWSDPLVALTQREEQLELDLVVDSRFAEAIGYAHTFSNFGQDRQAVANHLAIALVTLWRRCKRAERSALVQASLFDGIEVVPHDAIPPRAIVARKLGYYTESEGWLSKICRLLQAKLFPRASIPIRLLIESD